MTIEGRPTILGLIPIPFVAMELTRFDGELNLMDTDFSLTAIRVLSEDELAVFPYDMEGPIDLKKGEPKVLVREQIQEANIRGLIIERSSHILYYRITWRP